jgi:hypothetical protein
MKRDAAELKAAMAELDAKMDAAAEAQNRADVREFCWSRLMPVLSHHSFALAPHAGSHG